MARSTRGYYTFTDGSVIWFSGLSASERKVEEMKHGSIIKFVRTL